MPGTILHLGATVFCMHGGQAQPTATTPRVLVSGQPVVTRAPPYTVAGCALPPPALGGNGPCVTAMWTTSAVRVTSGGIPLVLLDSQAVCVPPGTPLIIAQTQIRATGT